MIQVFFSMLLEKQYEMDEVCPSMLKETNFPFFGAM